MANPGITCKGYMQFGRESTWGTGVAATKRLPIINHTIRQQFKQERDKSLTGSNSVRDIKNVLEYAAGEIELYLTYNELLMFFDGVYGTGTFGSTGDIPSGAGPFTHTFLDLDFFNSYTIQLIEGNIPAAGCQRVLGAKICGIKITGEAHNICHVTLSVVGKQMQTNQTPTGALSAATPSYALTGHLTASMTDGSGDASSDQIFRSFEFEHKNSCGVREGCGSAFTLEPIRTGPSMSRYKFKKEFRTVAAMNAWIAETAMSSVTIPLVSGALQITISTETAKITAYSQTQNPDDLIFAEIEMEGIDSATYDPSKIIVINQQATVIT